MNAAIKEQAAQLEIDRQELSLLEEKIKSGMSYEQAYAESIHKASIAAKEQAISTKGAAGTTSVFVEKQKIAQAEMKATGSASKVASIGVDALKMSLNMFAGIIFISIIGKVIEGIQYLASSAERAKEKLDEIKNTMSENKSSYESNKKTLEGLRSEYDSLSEKANKLGGVQNLANEEYERYTEITSQILGITPKLITGWDDEGTAISNKNGLLQKSIDLLDEEYEKAIRNNTTKSKNKEVAKGIIEKVNEFNRSPDTTTNGDTMWSLVNDFKNILNNINKEKYHGLGDYDIAEQFYAYLYPNEHITKEKSAYEDGWIGALLNKIQDEDDYQKLANSFADKNNPMYKLFSEEEINEMLENANDYNQEVQRIIDDREALYQDYKDQLNWNAQAVNTDDGKNAYKQLSDESKAALTEYIDNLDYASVKTVDDFYNMANNIRSFTKLLASDNDFSNYIKDIYTPQEDDESVEEYSKRIKDGIKNIQEYVSENKINVSLNFDDATKSVDALKDKYENTVNRFYNEHSQSLSNEKQNLTDEYKKISDWHLDDYETQIKNGTVQTKFGNVDMDKRTILHWSDELKKTYADALKSWDYDPEVGSIDTVYGASDRFGGNLDGVGWEVAFTPILPDGTFLSKDTVEKYFEEILRQAYADDGQVTDDELKKLDAQGMKIGNTFVQGIYAGVDASLSKDETGNDNKANIIGRLMHFSGKFGAIQIAKDNIEKYEKQVGNDGSERTKLEKFFKDNSINTSEEFDYWNDVTKYAKNATEAIDMYNEAKRQAMTFDIDSLTKKIDEIQNVYKTLKDAIKEYNKEGYISVDTFQSIIGLGADYLKYLVDEDGNLKLNAQSLQELTIARVKDMVVAQKNKILDTADGWSTEADAAQYLKANLDETSDSYDDIIEKKLQLLRIKWTEQLDENGNRVWSDEQIESTIAGLRKQFGSLDTVQNAAIKGIKSGFGMTGESAKDNTDKIKDLNKQLDDLAKSEALQKLKYKFDQLEQGITKIDTALSLLNNISDLTYEDDYIGKIEIVSNQLDLATSKAQLLQNEFEQLSAEQHDTADSSNELASRMKSTADSIAENQKQIIEYGKNITSYYMSALSAINSLSKNSIERATTLIDRNIKTLSEGGLTGLEFSFVPTVPQSAIEKQRNENQSLKNEMQSYYDSVAEMQKTALDLQYKEQMAENEKKRQEILKSLKEQQNDLNEHYATVEKAQKTHNATTQENQKQNDKAVVTEQKNTQTNSLNEVKNYVTQFQTIIQGFIDWLAQNPLHPTVEFANLNDIMDSTFIGGNNSTSLPTGEGSANDVVNTARSYVGKSSFTHAGNGKTLNSKDYCQAFVASVYKQAGVNSFYSSADTAADARHKWAIHKIWGKNGKIDYSQIPVGACIYSQCGNDKRGHVSIYSGNGKIIEAGTSTIREVNINDTTKNRKYYGWGFNGGVMPKYAKGTNNFGIYGENYRTEFAINKKTGEWFEANEPTLVNTDEYDVVGEKTSAKIKQIGKPLPMYATGTPISDPDVREMVKKVSSETGVPANILLSVIDQESNNTWSSGNPDSGGTSYGYMQLRTPGVLDDLPSDRRQAAMTDKYSNILEGAKFLKRLFDNYSDWTKAASAYNQGEAGFKRHGINKYGKDVVARANSTAFVQAAQDLSSISTAVEAVSTDTSDIATNTDTIATKDMKTELQNIVDSTSTPTELAKYQGDLLNYIKDNNSIQEKNNDEFLAAWEKLQAEDETAKSVLADYDKQLTDNRWSDNYNEIKDGATKYASSYAISTIKAQTDVQVNELLKQYDDEKAVLDDILKYFRERKANGASADELKVIAQTYSEQLQNVESTSDSYVSAIQSETDYLLSVAERNNKYVKDQVTWQEKINEGLERQAKLTSNVNDKLSLQKDIIDGNDTKRELYQKQKENAHRNVLDILNSDDKDYQEVLKQFQSVEPWFDATGEFSAQYEADLARLGASTPKLVPHMKQIASLIQSYKKAWYEADNEMQQTLDDTASRIDEVYATRTDKITKAISNSEWVLDMLGDGNFDLRLEETNTQLQNNLDKTVEIKKQQEYVNELYQRGSITYEQFVEKSQTLQEDLQSVYTTIKSILNSIKQIKIDTIQKNIDDINDQLEEIHDASDRITDSIDARMDVLNDEKDELDELQDKWDKVASAVKKVLSDQKELLDDEKESVSDYWDDRIKAIEKANEETDRNISLLEKQKELSEAKEQQTALIYQNGKFTYQADPKAVQDAEYALAEEQRSIKQDKAKEALEEQKDLAIKNIEDQIDAINKYQEKWDEVFDWYKNEVNEQAAYDQLGADWMNDTMALKTSILNQVGNAYKNNESIIEGSINEEIKALEKQEKALDRQVKAQERAANAKIRDYNKEIRAIEQTSDKFDDLYRQIVEYFKTGNTDAIPGIIKSFVEEFNSIVDNIDVNKLTNAIFQALGMSPIGTVNSGSTSTGNSTNTSGNSNLSFDEATKKAIEVLNDKGLDGLDEADKILLSNGYSLNKNSISTADGTGRKFIKVSDGDSKKYLVQSSDGKWILAADYSTAASIAGGSSGNVGESSNNGSNNSSSSNIVKNPTGTANNGMDYSETNQAEKNKRTAIDAVKAYQKQHGGAFNTNIFDSAPEAYEANVGSVTSSGKPILVIYKSGDANYIPGIIYSGDTMVHRLPGFAKGTNNAPRGLSIINDGNQYSGELVNFRGGEQVIPADKSIKLINGLTDLTESDLGKLLLENGSIQAQAFLEPFKQSLFDNSALQNLNNMKQVDNSITISNINMYETENVNDFVKQLNRQLPLAAKKIKR